MRRVKSLFGRRDDGEKKTSAWVARLDHVMTTRLRDQRAGAAETNAMRAAIAYVHDANDSTVFGLFPSIAWRVQSLFGIWQDYGPMAADLYEGFDLVDDQVAGRWIQVIEAAVAGNPHPLAHSTPGKQWPVTLLVHATPAASVEGDRRERTPIRDGPTAETFERLAVLDGLPRHALLDAIIADTSYFGPRARRAAYALPGFLAGLATHSDALRRHLLDGHADNRVIAVEVAARGGDELLTVVADGLASAMAASSKQLRAAARPVGRRVFAACVPHLQAIATGAKPEHRANALRCLFDLGGEVGDIESVDFARATASADRAAAVQQLADEWVTTVAAPSGPIETTAPPRPVIDWAVPVTPALQAAFEETAAKWNRILDERFRYEQEARARGGYRGHPPAEKPVHVDLWLRDFEVYLASNDVRPRKARRWIDPAFAIRGLASCGPVALAKFLAFVGELGPDTAYRRQGVIGNLVRPYERTGSSATLWEFVVMLEDLGVARDTIFASYCGEGYWSGIGEAWDDEAIASFADAYQREFIAALAGPLEADVRIRVLRGFRTMRSLPTAALTPLYDLALGSAKQHRRPAQDALTRQQGWSERVLAALGSGRGEVRSIAADWLTRERVEGAAAAIARAFRKEKDLAVKGSLLGALDLLGEPIATYLDQRSLDTDAAQVMAKGIPADLAWFPFDGMPPLTFAGSGEAVPREIVDALIVQAFRLKSPEPNALLRFQATLFDRRQREAFGLYVLHAWMAEDVRPISADEALARASHEANSWYQMAQHNSDYAKAYVGKTLEQIIAMVLPRHRKTPVGSAHGAKGVLAVAAACCGGEAADPSLRYIKEWYGLRVHQGRALLAMLAWIDHPACTQVMLAIGTRFRTKGLQDEATRQALALAERRGWTLEELADRTIPSGGFDDDGVLELPYGERMFSAVLRSGQAIELRSPDGKVIAALPEPRQSDDATVAADSKKAFAAARKDLKSIVTSQTSRLYEAMCTGRTWVYDDWKRYLWRHAVVRPLVERLVWLHLDGDDRVIGCFRPLPDRTLSDVDDEPVLLDPTARICLAHQSLLSPDKGTRWVAHLDDYGVKPLFSQFGSSTYRLAEDTAAETEIKDFTGHVLGNFSLRGRATKLGYSRGAAGDGGWVSEYEKRFPTIDLQAVITFTGTPLPEEDRKVGLLSLSFQRLGGRSWSSVGVPLGEVPAVLLAECHRDLRAIAAEGTGFDPDWQKVTQY